MILIMTVLTYMLVGVAIAEKLKADSLKHYALMMLGWPFVLFYRLLHSDDDDKTGEC